jgi:hypothetical protein
VRILKNNRAYSDAKQSAKGDAARDGVTGICEKDCAAPQKLCGRKRWRCCRRPGNVSLYVTPCKRGCNELWDMTAWQAGDFKRFMPLREDFVDCSLLASTLASRQSMNNPQQQTIAFCWMHPRRGAKALELRRHGLPVHVRRHDVRASSPLRACK